MGKKNRKRGRKVRKVPRNRKRSATTGSSLSAGQRIDVYYGRTDNTPGDKEYTCVVVQTSVHGSLQYSDDLYSPARGCQYKILNAVPMSRLQDLCDQEPKVSRPNSDGFVSSPLNERVLDYCKQHPETRSGLNYNLIRYAMR